MVLFVGGFPPPPSWDLVLLSDILVDFCFSARQRDASAGRKSVDRQ